MKFKKGFSLVVLLITIIVLVIITSVIILSTSSSQNLIDKNKFLTEMTNIEDSLYSYYITNNTLPVMGQEVTYDDLLNQVKFEGRQSLEDEFIYNSDTSSKIFKLDISKLDLLNVTDDMYDAYYFTYPNLNVYYIYGVNIDGNIYYSQKKLKKISVVDKKSTNNNKNNISIIKSSNNWTNSLDLNVNLIDKFDSQNDKIYIKFSNIEEKYEIKNITFDEGSNNSKFTIQLKSVLESNIQKYDSVENFLENNVTDENLIKFSALNNKSITIQKYTNNELVQEQSVDISNFDIKKPGILNYDVLFENNTKYLKIKSIDNDSNISGVYVDYVYKIDNNIIKTYYTDVIIDENFVLNKINSGLLQKLENTENEYTTKLENNITAVIVVVIDKAQNVSSIILNVEE